MQVKTTSTEVPLFTVGTLYRGWRVEREVARGGMGIVYFAQHQLHSRKAAIKVIRPPPGTRGDGAARERFLIEAELHVSLRHQNLPELYDADFVDDGTAILVLEWLDGRDLGETIRCIHRLSVADALFVTAEVLRALSAMHAQSVHRDIKPSNIYICRQPRLTADGHVEKGRIRLLDFGVAKLKNRKGPTMDRAILGTLNYMSPEQLSDAQLDARSDLYSLGAVLYEMLAGHPVFVPSTSADFHELASRHLHEPPPDLRKELPQLPDDVWSFLARLLEKNKESRFATTEDTLEVARQLCAKHRSTAALFRDDVADTVVEMDRLRAEGLGAPSSSVSSAALAMLAQAFVPTTATPVAPSSADPPATTPVSGVRTRMSSEGPQPASSHRVEARDTHRVEPLSMVPTWRQPQRQPGPIADPPGRQEGTMRLELSSRRAHEANALVEPSVRAGTVRLSGGRLPVAYVDDPERRVVDSVRELLVAPRVFVRPALTIESPALVEETIAITGRLTRIGTGPSVGIRLPGTAFYPEPLGVAWLDDRRLSVAAFEMTSNPDRQVRVDGTPATPPTILTHGCKLEIGPASLRVSDLAITEGKHGRSRTPRIGLVALQSQSLLWDYPLRGPLTLIGSSLHCDMLVEGVANVAWAVWLRGDGLLEVTSLDTSLLLFGEAIQSVTLATHGHTIPVADDRMLVVLDPEEDGATRQMTQRHHVVAPTRARAVLPRTEKDLPPVIAAVESEPVAAETSWWARMLRKLRAK